MTRELRRSPAAERDLDDIWFHIATDNEGAANRVLQRINDAEKRLLDYPELGEARPDLGPHLRKWTVGIYVVIYRVESDAIAVVRVLHGARDLPTLFDA